MSPVVFLGLALVVSVVGTLALWIRHRESQTPDSSIDEFRSKMRALSEQEESLGQPAPRTGRDDAARRGG